MSTQFTISPIGLVTEPNKLGIYPEGAMSRADGLDMIAPGKLVPFRNSSLFTLGVPIGGTGPASQCLVFPCGGRFFFAGTRPSLSTTLTAVQLLGNHGVGNTFITSVEAQQFLKSRAQSSVMQFKDRLYMLYSTGVAVLDAVDGSVTSTRWAQLPQPIVAFVTVSSSSLVSQNEFTVVGYSVVIRRKYADGYELISAPSPIVRKFRSNGLGQNVVVVIIDNARGFTAGEAGVRAGDLVEVYRTRERPSLAALAQTDPGTTLYQIATYTVTPTDVSSGSVTVTDLAAPDQIVGRELYTNPGQETLQSSRFPPPLAKCLAMFKGTAFYANTQEPGTWIAAFPGGWGVLTTPTLRANGVGRRPTTGTFTSGSPIVTGISAADIVGLKKHQNIFSTKVFGVPQIQSVGATSITMTANATASGAELFDIGDVIEINGEALNASTFELFTNDLGTVPAIGNLTAVFDQTGAPTGGIAYGQRMAIAPLRPLSYSNGISVRATNALNFNPPPADFAADEPAQTISAVWKRNKICWSWDQQPESVSLSTYAFIGNGEIYALATTRDVMWIFASDGLWRFTGYGTRSSGIQANYRVDLIDRTVRLVGPSAYCVLRDAVFAYTNIGLVKISDEVGVKPLSRGVIGDLLPGRNWIESDDVTMAADEDGDRVWLNITSGSYDAGTGVSNCYVWNEQYGVFTKLNQWVGSATVLQRIAYDKDHRSMLLGLGDASGIYTYWFDPDNANFSGASADFQPQYGPDPASSKQWLDMCVMFDKNSAGKSITPRFNGVAYGSNPLVQYPLQDDSRAYFGVSEDAPAVANLMAPGFSIGIQSTITELRGIAMRYEAIDEQGLVWMP